MNIRLLGIHGPRGQFPRFDYISRVYAGARVFLCWAVVGAARQSEGTDARLGPRRKIKKAHAAKDSILEAASWREEGVVAGTKTRGKSCLQLQGRLGCFQGFLAIELGCGL